MTGRNRQERLGVSSAEWPEWPDPERRSRVRLVLMGSGVLVAIALALVCASAVGEAAAERGAERSTPTNGATKQRC